MDPKWGLTEVGVQQATAAGCAPVHKRAAVCRKCEAEVLLVLIFCASPVQAQAQRAAAAAA